MSFSSLNFEIKESHKLFISPFDRGFIFGDAVYEMILCIDGRCIFLEDHLARLKQSLASIKLIPDFKEKNLEDEINRIANVNDAPFQAEDGIRDDSESRGLGDVYKRQIKG